MAKYILCKEEAYITVISILILHKINIKSMTKIETFQNDKMSMSMMKIIHQEYITIITVYVSNNTASRYKKQKLTELKRKREKSIITEILTSPPQQLI